MPITSRKPPRKRPTGRRAGDSGTRGAILDAALTLFSERGYDGASLRAIAQVADIDPALIRYYFGDKEALFIATVADRTTIPERLAGALAGDPGAVGQRATDAYLRLWDDPDTRPILLALVRSATASPRAADMLQEILGSRIQIHAPAATSEFAQRIALAGSHLFGLAAARYILRVPAITALDHDTLVAMVAPTIQHYLTGDDLQRGRADDRSPSGST